MYFEEAPKKDLKDLYNYREELNRLVNAVEGGARLITLEGPRRTGKTSLLLTALGQMERPSIVIDAREFSSSSTITSRDLIQSLERGLNKFLAEKRTWRDRLSSAFKGLKGVEVEPGLPPRISLTWGGRREEALDPSSILEAIGRAAERGSSFILALDESQEFKRLAGVTLPGLMAHVYDYVPGIQWIVTGSQVGMLNDFLGVDNPRAPLFGRVVTRIRLNRLSPEKAAEFLEQGFRQISMTVDPNQVLTIVEKLDGIVGWLTYVGVVSRRLGGFDEAVLGEAMKQGSRLAASEFSNFLSLRPQARLRYDRIMKAMADGPRRWSEIRRSLENQEGRSVPDFTFNQLLTNLVKGGFVENTPEGLYFIADPLLRQAASDHLF